MALSTHACWPLITQETADGTHVSFAGNEVSLDETTIGSIEEELFRLVEELGRCRLILDFSNVTYITSSTLGVLLTLQKKLHLVGGRLYIASAQPYIFEIFSLTRLTQLLNVTSLAPLADAMSWGEAS